MKNSSMRKLALLAALLLAIPAHVLTQAPAGAPDAKGTSVSKVERKNKAPISKEVLRVRLPKPREMTLDNGLTVLVLEDHRTPTVSLQLQIQGAGGLHDPSGSPGLANITAQMLREGTKTRSSRQISEEVERLGASIGASAGFGSDITSITASGLSDNMQAWTAVAADILLHPSFPAEELNRLKQRLKAQLKQQRSSPNFLLNERFHRAVYGSHPAAVVSTTEQFIDALTPETLAKWRRERYAPQNAILGIAGDVRMEQLKELRKLLDPWKKTELKLSLPPNPIAVAKKKVLLVHRPGSVQTAISLGNIAIDRRDPDYIALTVANRIFGSGPTGRLFLNLREEKGYTYGAYSSLSAMKYPGPWEASSEVRTEVTEGAMKEFLYEIRRIRDDEVSRQELEEAKRSIVARFALSLEQPSDVLGYALTRKIYGFPEDYWDTYPQKIMAVTFEDVQRVARRYLDPESVQIAAVGDAEKVRAILEKYGPVEVYDTAGKPLAAAAAP